MLKFDTDNIVAQDGGWSLETSAPPFCPSNCLPPSLPPSPIPIPKVRTIKYKTIHYCGRSFYPSNSFFNRTPVNYSKNCRPHGTTKRDRADLLSNILSPDPAGEKRERNDHILMPNNAHFSRSSHLPLYFLSPLPYSSKSNCGRVQMCS